MLLTLCIEYGPVMRQESTESGFFSSFKLCSSNQANQEILI